MSRIRNFFKILIITIKSIFLVLSVILKLILTFVPRLFRAVFQVINKRLRFSITFKTTVTYTLLFSVIFLLCSTLIISAFGFFLLYNSNQTLTKNSLVIMNMINQQPALPDEQIKSFADIQGISVTLSDEHKNPIYSTNESSPHRASYFQLDFFPGSSLDYNLEYLHYETRVNLNGISKIDVSQNLYYEKTYLAALLASVCIGFLFAIIIIIIIGSRTSRRMLNPIDNMTRTARSIAVGDLNTRLVIVDSHDELKELALTFNDMLDRIQISFDKQNIFVSDASHELKTPISVIQGYANLLQRWGKEDNAVLQESISAIRSESEYMKELVEKLLFLASTDKNSQDLATSPFALNELINEILKESILIDSEHQFRSEINEVITLNGDRALIKQAFRIFLDNSRKYTPAGGTIAIDSCLKNKNALISINDEGIGISQEDLPYIFDRFYKADKSRNRAVGGVGLGLSIAKWIIDQHHGNIVVESIKNKGTRIMVTLPVANIFKLEGTHG
ncbi:MAG: HAMP domain-containing sensor histidine kinase [Syntrophomonas sp.]|nr:HAMP domain-containing sensor histidine kinase [Syntrophomonas sp.]